MEKIWLKRYQQGVPTTINTQKYTSLVDLFQRSCEQHADHIAYSNMNTSLTYRELAEQVDAFASFLQQMEIPKGARVAIMLPNLLQYPIALFGTLQAGCIVVNTNPLYTTDEVVQQLSDSEAEVLVVLSHFAKIIEKASIYLPHLKHILITDVADCFPWYKRFLINAVIRHVKRLVPSYHLPQAKAFRHALQKGQERAATPVSLAQQDVAFIQYTGGTTGVSKGAILTHGNLIANVLQALSWVPSMQLGSQDLIVTALPLYHIFSMTANCLLFLHIGAHNLLITNPRDIKDFIRTIRTKQFTAITGVNTLFNALLNHPQFSQVDFSKLKLALAGGMALQKTVAERWSELTKTPVIEAYGLTETSPAVTINPLDIKGYNGSIGLPLPSTEVSIRNQDGEEVPIGENGELCIKGPQVMSGYWRRDDETALVFWPDRFLRTGDIAHMDEQGFIYLVDRKKDMILVSGFNVYPNEVEHVISLMSEVLEVGVIGIPSETSGERVKACIVKRKSSLTEKQVIDHCRKHLTPYKVPKVVEFYAELPKSNVGKILRRALK